MKLAFLGLHGTSEHPGLLLDPRNLPDIEDGEPAAGLGEPLSVERSRAAGAPR